MNTVNYKIGDKVVIVTKRVPFMNDEGHADHWLGKVMTIREIECGSYHMVEDEGEFHGTGWWWDNSCIDHKATAKLNKETEKESITMETITCTTCGQVIEGREGYDFIRTADGEIVCKECIIDGEVDGYVVCEDCGKIIRTEDSNDGYHDGNSVIVCDSCFRDYHKCDECGDYYHEDDMETDHHGTWVCKDCFDNNYIRCNDCGCIIRNDETNFVHDRNGYEADVCEDCFDDYRYCDHCNEYYWYRNVHSDDNGTVICDDCYDEYYTTCYDCDCIISRDEAEDCDGYDYCTSCASEYSGRNAIMNYSFKPTPCFCNCNTESTKLYMGVELEIDKGYGENETANDIIETMDFNGTKHVYCKHDGSLDDGIEIVSHPCTLQFHMDKMPWEDVMDIAKEHGFRSHDAGTCGLHVHVSRNFFGNDMVEQDLAIAKLIMLVDKFWDKIVPFTRRNSSQLSRWANKNCIDIVESDNLEDVQSKMNNQKRQGRYHAINLQNTYTIEFRIFRGTLRYETFIATLQFVHTLSNYAKSVALNDIYTVTWDDIFANTEFEELRSYMQSKGLLETATSENN